MKTILKFDLSTKSGEFLRKNVCNIFSLNVEFQNIDQPYRKKNFSPHFWQQAFQSFALAKRYKLAVHI